MGVMQSVTTSSICEPFLSKEIRTIWAGTFWAGLRGFESYLERIVVSRFLFDLERTAAFFPNCGK